MGKVIEVSTISDERAEQAFVEVWLLCTDNPGVDAERNVAVDGRRRDTFWWPPYAIVFTSAILSLPIVYWVTYLDHRQNPPPCFGLGWGCTLDAGTTVVFFGVLIALPGLIVASVLLVGMGLAGYRTRLLRLWVAGAVLPALLVGIFLIG